ncbi:MAG TPA: hypothetical protein VGO93_22965 [Candidatus Xenobia bacterium]|jgi:hypothetical protein
MPSRYFDAILHAVEREWERAKMREQLRALHRVWPGARWIDDLAARIGVSLDDPPDEQP